MTGEGTYEIDSQFSEEIFNDDNGILEENNN